jgi:hypothetical protein
MERSRTRKIMSQGGNADIIAVLATSSRPKVKT